MHFAAAGHVEPNASVESVSVTLRETSLQRFTDQPVPQITGCHIFAVSAGKRRIVDDEGRLHGRSAGCSRRKRLRCFGIADRIAYGDITDTGDGDDIAGVSLGDGFLCREAVEFVDVRNPRFVLPVC